MMQSTKSETALQESSTEYVDLSDYCRLCLQVPEESQLLDLQLIYDEEENLSYYDCFTVCTQIDLHAGGVNAPHQLCKSCGLELQVAYDFHKKVEESKKFLMQLNKTEQLDEEFLSTSPPIAKESYENSNVTTPTQIESNIQTVTEDVVEQAEDKTNDPQLILALHVNDAANENEIANSQEIIAGHLATPIEYEALEEHMEMEDYQSVDELVDEDIEKDQHIAAFKIEKEEPVILPIKMHANESPIKPTILVNLAPPSDEDDINLKEYLFENQDLIPKVEDQFDTMPRKRGRHPLIPGGPPYQCEYCDHMSPSRQRLASHRHRKHRFNKPSHKCDECSKEFSTKQQLERHQQRITCQTYPIFKCEFCEKTCIGRANYQIHLRFHKKIYPFVCHICAKSFMLATHLTNHVKTKHEGQRFICEQSGCGKMFQTSHALKNHTYTHVKQLPYRCDYCQHDFPTKGRLRWHISRVHAIDHTLEELDCMLVAKEIELKAQLQPALEPDSSAQIEEINADELADY
ncbi:PREDICTED: zinc finger protein 177 isoform X3 [Rhagoletis zephyria]|uniref:zinc finger protein 177 isoform X3 n=1 Tax=Rhagoletis zephyria TaxID=28612 RepID=UPI000811294B|nr:PREDICTED: zinc finger protein 177 isoform X3 [Rhagoletis zephyria]